MTKHAYLGLYLVFFLAAGCLGDGDGDGSAGSGSSQSSSGDGDGSGGGNGSASGDGDLSDFDVAAYCSMVCEQIASCAPAGSFDADECARDCASDSGGDDDDDDCEVADPAQCLEDFGELECSDFLSGNVPSSCECQGGFVMEPGSVPPSPGTGTCADLTACCAQTPEPADCEIVVDMGNDTVCSQLLDVFRATSFCE